jgi:hypothetical protein
MKFVEPNQFADPDAAPRKLQEIAIVRPFRTSASTSSWSTERSSKLAAHGKPSSSYYIILSYYF